MFSLESPHRGDSNEYTQHAIINIKMKDTLNYPKYNNVCSFWIFSLGTQERVRKNRGHRAIGIRAIEVRLYMQKLEVCFDEGALPPVFIVFSVSLRKKKQTTKFTCAKSQKKNRPKYVILSFQRLEGKQGRSSWDGLR